MVANFSLQKQENCNRPSTSSLKSYCELHAKQLTYHYQIYCVRVVYHELGSKKHQEIVQYAENKPSFSIQKLAYLRLESWLEIFPHVFEVYESKLTDIPDYYSYICLTGYKNQKPEYIQIITTGSLSIDLQNQLKDSAVILSKFTEVYSENLYQKSKIQLLEHILHKAAHEVRSSLALISLYAYNLSLKLPDVYCRQQAIVIHENVQELDNRLTKILSCSQGVKLSIASQDLKKIVAESIKFLQPLINQKQLKINIPDTSVTLSIDKLQIQQVFDNLISNAIHFSPDFGKITLSWQIFQEEVLIKISDQGPGIPPEDMQKIFNPFYSRRLGGTGLGLAIAKKIVLDHFGSLSAQNLPEGGATFSLIMPRK